jgi:hypothetical protein
VSIFAALLIAAQATSTPTAGEEDRFVATFTDICLQNMGNAGRQTTTATQSPFGFTKGEKGGDGIQEYLSGKYRLGIGAPLDQCALSHQLSGRSNLDSVVTTMSNAIGTDQGQQLEEPDSRYWLIAGPADEEFVLAVKVSDQRLATLWVQRRSSVLQSNNKAN